VVGEARAGRARALAYANQNMLPAVTEKKMERMWLTSWQ